MFHTHIYSYIFILDSCGLIPNNGQIIGLRSPMRSSNVLCLKKWHVFFFTVMINHQIQSYILYIYICIISYVYINVTERISTLPHVQNLTLYMVLMEEDCYHKKRWIVPGGHSKWSVLGCPKKVAFYAFKRNLAFWGNRSVGNLSPDHVSCETIVWGSCWDSIFA